MLEQSWGEGYVVDVDYTTGFYRELTPALLRFVTLLGGVQAAGPDAPFVYHELGCGNGYTTALLAAANPGGRFFGVDFNPTHINNARKLASDGGVGNASFVEKSFGELLEADLPEAEFIALHGVWSWVSEENRRQIVEFVRRKLKPGGIFYVSYNSLPGLSQVAPLQRLLFDHSNLGGGERMERVRRSLDFARRLEKAGADYFRVNPLAKARLASLDKHDPHYVAHEYYNSHWLPFYHADVARDLAGAKLAYAGSAILMDNFEQFSLKPETAKLAAETGDRTMAETVKDFARNQVFRKDVFTRGAPRAEPRELETMLGRTRFALARPRSSCALSRKTPAGDISLHEDAHAPVLEALARGPATFDERARAKETAKLDRVRLRQSVFGLAAFGNVLPALPADGEDARRAAAARFNRAMLAQPPAGQKNTVLASPVIGSGVALNFLDRIFVHAPLDERGAVDYARKAVAAKGMRLVKEGKPVESDAEAGAVIEERARFFLAELLPFLRGLGVIE